MVLLAASNLISVTPPNLSPEWTGTPAPMFAAGIGGSYDLDQDTTDPEGAAITYVLSGGPANVSISGSNLVATAAVTEGTTTGVTVTADDGTNSPVTSPSFTITVFDASWGITQGSVANLPIFPGLRGWGTDTVAGSGRHLVGDPATIVLYVDSLATGISNTDSTHGSLYWCLTQTFPRTIVPAISGLITFPVDTVIDIPNPYVTYAGQCAPGDGLHVHRVQLDIGTKEVLIWHWSGFQEDATQQGTADCTQLGSSNAAVDQDKIVLANCTGMYGLDETISAFNSGNAYTPNYTIWQCMVAEPMDPGDEYGVLMDNTSTPVPHFSFLRNYMVHCDRRCPRINGGVGEVANNLGYNNSVNIEFDPTNNFHAANTINNFINNGFVFGPSHGAIEPIVWEDSDGWGTGGTYYEGGNVKHSGYDAVPMTNNSTGESYAGSASASAVAEGWVPVTITDSDAGLLAFSVLMFNHVGAYPSNRLAVHQAVMDHCTNKLNITGPDGDFPGTVAVPSVASVTINHTTTGSHSVGVIPTGAAQDVVQASGYTALEEWLHDHNDWAFGFTGWRL